jgi:hypothetical protein
MAWPDIVAVTIAYLDGLSSLNGVTVSNEVPSTMPTKLLQVRRVGGAKAPPVRDRGRLDLIAWANTSAEAMTLALLARTEVNALRGTTTGGVTIYLIEEFLGPRQVDDPVTGKKRVMQTQTLTFRADEAIR